MTKIHNLGFPRIGKNRELKIALERYWHGEIDADALLAVGAELRARHWQLQSSCGLDYLPVGDFSYYDHVLDTTAMLGAIPPRFNWQGSQVDLDTYFRMARGQSADGSSYRALEMTKWFDTNYHYLVPEISADQKFSLACTKLFDETRALLALGHQAKPVLLGPLSWLWLAKTVGHFDKLDLLERLLPVYQQILQGLVELDVDWLQIDEPILVMDLPDAWQRAFEMTYATLQHSSINILLTSYFGGLADNTALACRLPVAGLHIDLTRAPEQLDSVLANFSNRKVLSLGLVDGRNIWRTDLTTALATVEQVRQSFLGHLWLAPSCSLLHVPIDLARETGLNPLVKPWLAFARQKLTELELLRLAFVEGIDAAQPEWDAAAATIASRSAAAWICNNKVRARLENLAANLDRRLNPFPIRKTLQQQKLNLPLFPTTTIGSFPQTTAIRKARLDYKRGTLAEQDYRTFMAEQIKQCVREQEALGLDVLVHGEPERNDMVEYFGERLDGFMFTSHGWVQSFGSRYVKPPIIYADVSRPLPMTVSWSYYAQSLTDRPMKGMLTGPVTLLNWSFVRDDQSREQTAYQLALAIRDEVIDLEQSGIQVIQIDEPAFREGLPLRQADWPSYLNWAARAFRISAGGVDDATQIHTHMCYAEFNDIIAAIADLDADVITIETSRSNMELLDAFTDFDYPNQIGPGVFDIHSPNLPATETMVELLKIAASRLTLDKLWVNPDCGLKTRQWSEVRPALAAMVNAAKQLREIIV
ncbi:5-methyltetrahydropteroyltriglutamate--homocysteine S-methyltransferase [Methylomonas paludis]|uniref:5-methyltetrahydropteroyltriglutamate--homocysteine methyltransferase n=1 Tax=Methylomonas paludis TaxID=1173101 RepID=A0A975MPX1_9GAMM|nr:5-methyltetrahydropteroyltriglutamate--homocysteine S-methyltransferase [Methylomonas paludis]QWF71304.1 5-methyltetrahydropteroyltriglutamate--homocysteine S-methyltransferase [Methylomonas paludis]